MRSYILVSVAMAVLCAPLPGQGLDGVALARRLADSNSRAEAVEKIIAQKDQAVPLLLSLAQRPPDDIDSYEFDVGLADVFGRLKTEEAIPFLIRNIGLNRYHSVNVWLKTPEAVEKTLPAAAALIQIGPDAAKALIHAYWEPMPAEDRPAAIFVIARVLDSRPGAIPEGRVFLQSVRAELNVELRWADRGLALFNRMPK